MANPTKTLDVELASVETDASATDKDPSCKSSISNQRRSQLILLSLFASWFAIDSVYNISNKETLQKVNLQWTLAALHFLIGGLYYMAMWTVGWKPTPILSLADVVKLLPLATFTLITHLSAVMAIYLGSVSFMHIVKASEPLSSAILTIFILRERYPWPVYASFLPVIVGIGLASYHENNFSIWALVGALVSMLASSLRGIYSKRLMKAPIGTNLTPSNLYGVLTIMAFLLLLVPCIVLEPPVSMYKEQFARAAGKGHSAGIIVVWAVLSSVTYTWFNEISYLALNQISPVTYAVANTSKRTIIIVSSVLWFRNRITPLGWVGGAISIVGVLVYSLVKLRFKQIKM
ncbi:unnamed protein product (mitochondrion) [Plasmodiophora brassicae]|uniref:Sugar phosphate transporter domain-containing protein n=1 Tax=Plasmodiophora brassicae TaxID=37360 RepID=A0A0G4J4H9_PLABS|nr:hypothetical protein PBRA_009001 [Plasmodiophora brassicae]SPQ99922.1 unnamed protein product [Plasmodiophora brassicae]